jgi:hypothetical protein
MREVVASFDLTPLDSACREQDRPKKEGAIGRALFRVDTRL